MQISPINNYNSHNKPAFGKLKEIHYSKKFGDPKFNEGSFKVLKAMEKSKNFQRFTDYYEDVRVHLDLEDYKYKEAIDERYTDLPVWLRKNLIPPTKYKYRCTLSIEYGKAKSESFIDKAKDFFNNAPVCKDRTSKKIEMGYSDNLKSAYKVLAAFIESHDFLRLWPEPKEVYEKRMKEMQGMKEKELQKIQAQKEKLAKQKQMEKEVTEIYNKLLRDK